MVDRKDAWKRLGQRALLSIPFLFISVYLLRSVGTLNFLELMIAVCFLVPPAWLMSDPISELLSGPMSSFYHPDKKRSRPMLMFSQPEACIVRGRYEEAMVLLRNMIEIDPARAQIYIRIIDLSLRHMGDHAAANDAFRTGMRNIEDPDKRNYLAEEYHRLLLLFPERAPGHTDDGPGGGERAHGNAFGWSGRRDPGNRSG